MGRGGGRIYRRCWTDALGKTHKVLNYTAEYQFAGRQFRESCGTADRQQALSFLQQRLEARKAGRVVKNLKVTLRALRDVLTAHYRTQGHRSTDRMVREFELHLEPFFEPGCLVRDITRQRVQEYVQTRLAAGASRSSVKLSVSYLNSAFGAGVEAEILSVYPGFALPKGSAPRATFFEPEEFERLLAAMANELKPLVGFLYLTGFRSTEARLLCWRNCNFEREEIRLEASETKSGEPKIFPFKYAPQLKEILLECWRRRDGGDYVFGWAGTAHGKSALNYGWNKACKASGNVGKTPHSLRRSACRNLIRVGIGETTVMRLMSWKSATVFRNYLIQDDTDLQEAVKRRFNKLITTQRPESVDNASVSGD